MKKKITIIFENYEKISEYRESNLVGGFSKSFSNQGNVAFNVTDNNCHGSNCFAGCNDGGNRHCQPK